jgi:hypothetical protein
MLMASIESLGVGAQQPFHPNGQVRIRCFQNQMKVICHQTIGMHLPTGLQTSLPKRAQKFRPVVLIQQYRFAPISTAEHMIKRACVVYPEGTGHHANLSGNQSQRQDLGVNRSVNRRR